MGHIYRLTSGFSQTLKGWENCCFLETFFNFLVLFMVVYIWFIYYVLFLVLFNDE